MVRSRKRAWLYDGVTTVIFGRVSLAGGGGGTCSWLTKSTRLRVDFKWRLRIKDLSMGVKLSCCGLSGNKGRRARLAQGKKDAVQRRHRVGDAGPAGRAFADRRHQQEQQAHHADARQSVQYRDRPAVAHAQQRKM